MKHFEFKMIPVSHWRRIKGTNPKGDDCARPHFIPVTTRAMQFAALDAFGGCGSTGLCPGEILMGSAWVTGYRFISITSEAVTEMLADLNEGVEKFFASI